MKKRNPASLKSSRPENRRRPYSPARKFAILVARAWPLWLALAVATTVFSTLSHPIASRHQLLRQAAALPGEIAWLERALAAAASSQNIHPGSPIAPETWRAHLDPRAPNPLRLQGNDAFGHPYGPQSADRPVRLHPSTTHLLLSLNQPPPHPKTSSTPSPQLINDSEN